MTTEPREKKKDSSSLLARTQYLKNILKEGMAPSFFSSSLLLSLSSLPLFFFLSLSLWEATVKDLSPELSYTEVEYERQSKRVEE